MYQTSGDRLPKDTSMSPLRKIYSAVFRSLYNQTCARYYIFRLANPICICYECLRLLLIENFDALLSFGCRE